MRVKKICLQCGYTSCINTHTHCPACGNIFTKLGYFKGKKIVHLKGDERFKWIEEHIIGHPIPEEFAIQRDNYRKMVMVQTRKNLEELENYRKEQIQQYRKNIAHANTPKCPICGSTNLSKISVTRRVAKTAAFGALGALDDAGKTYRCGSCGSKF